MTSETAYNHSLEHSPYPLYSSESDTLPKCAQLDPTPSNICLDAIHSRNTPIHAQKPRISIFKEVDVDGLSDVKGLQASMDPVLATKTLPHDQMDGRSLKRSLLPGPGHDSSQGVDVTLLSQASSSTSRLLMLALVAVIMIPLVYDTPLLGKVGPSILGAKAGVIRRSDSVEMGTIDGRNAPRANSPTDVCSRWSHQSALVNGTIYIYGGHATNTSGQSQNTWNNDFFSIPLNKDWQITTPPLVSLPQPSGPPAISNGFLWNSYTSLFLYGGEFSDKPVTSPVPYALWEYDILSSKWIEHSNPKTSAGNNSDNGNQPVQPAAEGAGVSVPALGRGWFFAGHQDFLTTAGWSIEIGRVYLKSLVEFTFPGFSNDGVQSLGGGKTAGQDGVWRNVTQGGIQDSNAFPSRADGALTYVPGYGPSGILLSLAGGTNESFVSLYATINK